jgi:hypothetical protein
MISVLIKSQLVTDYLQNALLSGTAPDQRRLHSVLNKSWCQRRSYVEELLEIRDQDILITIEFFWFLKVQSCTRMDLLL